MKICIVAALAIALATAISPAVAETVPKPVRAAHVSAAAIRDGARGLFSYRYRIVNPGVSQSQIHRIELDLTLGSNEARLSREGLLNGPGYSRSTSEANFQQVPMVPVGMMGPDGWRLALGIGGDATHGYAGWSSQDQPSDIAPGQVKVGFGLMSPGLPGIRTVTLKPPVDYQELPDEYADPDEAARFVETLFFRTKTVGPKAPPARFVPVEVLNYLVALLHESRQQGWVKVDGVHQSLLAKLLAAKRALEANRLEPARGELKAFLHEVQAVSCPEFACPGQKPLTGEAYALLYFNGQYLLERLP